MADTYGDIFSMKIGSRLVVVLNRPKAIREALVKKASVFAGRPALHSFSIASGGGKCGVAFVDYSPKQQALRKLSQNAMHKYLTSPEMLEGKIQAECHRLLDYFKKHQGKPFDPRNIFKIATSNIIVGILFGTNFPYGHKDLQAMLDTSDAFKDEMGGGAAVDFMPWLGVFPSGNLNKLSHLYNVFVNLVNKLYLENKSTFVYGKVRNLADTLLKLYYENNKKALTEETSYTLNDKDLLWTLTDLFGAAMDTSSVSLSFALGYLIKYPAIQAQIQAEVDTVLGCRDSVKMKDVERLHYLKAFVYEIFRITSVLPTSIPHSTTADTTLEGYFIPKGTLIFPNLWSAHQDPTAWKDPAVFDPRRFLDEKHHVIDPHLLPGFMPFSIGRRKCPGYELGIQQICMILATLVHSCAFTQEGLDPKYKVLDLTPVYGMSMKPSTYYLKVESRKEE